MPGSFKKIVIAPLDWGLGHATRCIPIINEFLNRGCEVQIASSGLALVLLKKEFPELKVHSLWSYHVAYSIRIPFMIGIFFQAPKFLWAIRNEHQQMERIVKMENIDLIISDNRYGCWSAHVPSILITHQVNIRMAPVWKWLERFINYGNHRQIKKFTECWVPDFPNGITGRMTEPANLKVRFIGMLSRLKKIDTPIKFDILALISGPEPQRSVFERMLRGQLIRSGLNYFMVKGKPGSLESGMNANEVNHLTGAALNEAIQSANVIISRSGYTTIMDLCKLGKKAIFIPTPGQTEQEYLADQLESKGIAFFQNQADFDLAFALKESKKHKGFEGYPHSSNLLADAIDIIS